MDQETLKTDAGHLTLVILNDSNDIDSDPFDLINSIKQKGGFRKCLSICCGITGRLCNVCFVLFYIIGILILYARMAEEKANAPGTTPYLIVNGGER